MPTLAGVIADGTGAPLFRGSVRVENEMIVEVRREEPGTAAGNAEPVIAPGFIDIHSHADHFLLVDPSAASKLMQGVTTDVIGNCGYSAAPLTAAMRERRERGLKRYGLKPSWRGFGEYLEALDEARPAVNVAALAGHGTLRSFAGVPPDRAALARERSSLAKCVSEALSAGAFGLSSGLFYAPARHVDPLEMDAAVAPVAEAGRLYAAHIRDERDRVVESLEEALDTVRRARVRFQYAHVKAWGRPHWAKARRLRELMRRARSGGLDAAMDLYPYTSAATELAAGIGLSGTHDADRVRRAVRDLVSRDPHWPRRVRILSSLLPGAAGRTIAELGPDAADCIAAILEADPATSAAFDELSESNLRLFLREPYAAIGSDASNRNTTGPLSSDRPHPRAFGTFPRVLARYVRGGELLSLEEAVRRMTALPAERLGIRDRGRIAPGLKADLVAFDPGSIADRASFRTPRAAPRGILGVWVNGVPAVVDGVLTGERAGRVLRAESLPVSAPASTM